MVLDVSRHVAPLGTEIGVEVDASALGLAQEAVEHGGAQQSALGVLDGRREVGRRGADGRALELEIGGIGAGHLRRGGGRAATLGVAHDAHRVGIGDAAALEVLHRPGHVQHRRALRLAVHVRVRAGRAQALVVGHPDRVATADRAGEADALVLDEVRHLPRGRAAVAHALRARRIGDLRALGGADVGGLGDEDGAGDRDRRAVAVGGRVHDPGGRDHRRGETERVEEEGRRLAADDRARRARDLGGRFVEGGTVRLGSAGQGRGAGGAGRVVGPGGGLAGDGEGDGDAQDSGGEHAGAKGDHAWSFVVAEQTLGDGQGDPMARRPCLAARRTLLIS